MRIRSIVVRCFEFEKMMAFWQEALHYVPREPAKDGWVVLIDPGGMGPNLSLDRVAERRMGKRSRLHLDLYTPTSGPKLNASKSWGPHATPGDVVRTTTSSSCGIPTTTCSVSWINPRESSGLIVFDGHAC